MSTHRSIVTLPHKSAHQKFSLGANPALERNIMAPEPPAPSCAMKNAQQADLFTPLESFIQASATDFSSGFCILSDEIFNTWSWLRTECEPLYPRSIYVKGKAGVDLYCE